MNLRYIKFIPIATLFLLSFFSVVQYSCKKYLDAKPDKSLATPQTINELQQLLDFEENNIGFPTNSVYSDDNVYFTEDGWKSIFFPDERLSYVWDGNIDFTKDWAPAYQRIFRANVVLNELAKINDKTASAQEYNNVKGSALFYRAINFYELSQTFAVPYSPQSSSSGFGVPLKTSPNIDEVTVRSTIKETYDKITEDLKASIPLLPASIIHKTRPGKAAAYALLARTYLVTNDYINAGKYADSCLQYYNNLLDYNDLAEVNPSSNYPFKVLNKEVIFHAASNYVFDLLNSKVDSVLYDSYESNDIRKAAFFHDNGDGSFQFKGNYAQAGIILLFCGIATDEIYLIRAECKARAGKVQEAMDDLNILLNKRWKAGTFIGLTANTADEALRIILKERRKELCYRPGSRWSDLRRLNTDDRFSITLKRILGMDIYELVPNDNRYTFLIPHSVISISSIQQNPR